MHETRTAPGKTFRERGCVPKVIEMLPKAGAAEDWFEDTIAEMAAVVPGLDCKRLRNREFVP